MLANVFGIAVGFVVVSHAVIHFAFGVAGTRF
jgi:hypothetical protein